MKQGKRKKKRSRAGKEVVVAEPNQSQNQNDEDTILKALVEAFCLASMDEAASAYREANCDPNKAAEILGALNSSSSSEARIGSSSSSGPSCGSSACSTSGSSEGFVETGCVQNVVAPVAMAVKGFRGSKAKNRVVASTGTVAGMLGKEYVMWQPKMESKAKGFGGLKEEEAEQFLCGMLGDECELSLAVVRDVLCQCGYNVEKALDALLDLSAASYEQAMNHRYFTNGVDIKEQAKLHFEQSDSLTNRVPDSTSHSSENELLDSIWSMGDFGRNYSEVLASSETKSPTSPRYTESDLPHKVLDSLFNISKSSEHEPSTMNWRNVVKKMESLGHVYPTGATEPQQDAYAKGDEYRALRKPASQHFDSMRSYYQKAATAYTKGNREHAAYLSEQGRLQSRIAKEADEEASQNIFKARNKDIENLITIDLHGQHVKQAMRLLKLHLVFGTFVPSVQTIRVITGCGSHGLGKSKLKESVIQLLRKEGIGWIEENRGTLLIRLAGQRALSFLDCDSETETD